MHLMTTHDMNTLLHQWKKKPRCILYRKSGLKAMHLMINGYHIFRHNGGEGNHNYRGVVIVLSPKYYKGWKAAGSDPHSLLTDRQICGTLYASMWHLKATQAGQTRQVQGKTNRQQAPWPNPDLCNRLLSLPRAHSRASCNSSEHFRSIRVCQHANHWS